MQQRTRPRGAENLDAGGRWTGGGKVVLQEAGVRSD